MNEKEKLIIYKKIIDRTLASFFYNQKKQQKNKSKFFSGLLDNFAEYTLRKSNKRIRAILVVLSYQLFGGNDLKKILEVAISMELLHSGLLIHDDIIDQDLYRRGGLSFHYLFEKYHQANFKKGESKHFGQCMGILAGDVGFAFAYKSLIESRLTDKIKFKILGLFNKMYYETCYGETLDVVNGYEKKVREKDVFDVYKYKTAKYTIETPLLMGAVSAGASDKNLQQISKFALPLGIAFQIKDDILGMFGNRERIGKPVTSDLEEGKETLLIIKTFQKANEKQKKSLLKYFGHKNLKMADLNKVRNIIIETGGLKYSQDYAKILVSKAKKALFGFKNVNNNSLSLLNYLADYIIERKY